MSFRTWSIFMVTELMLCLSPGPAVLFVVAQGLRHGGRQSVWANLGILSANSFYFALSAIGLGAVLLASQGVYQAIRFLGAAYLIYLGLAAFFGKGASMAAPGPGGASERAGSRQTMARRTPVDCRSTTAVKSGPKTDRTAAKRCSVKWKSRTWSSTRARRVSRFQAR